MNASDSPYQDQTYYKILNHLFGGYIHNYTQTSENTSVVVLNFGTKSNVTSSSFPVFTNKTQKPDSPSLFAYYDHILQDSFQLLNTSRAGSAHKHYGQSLKQFFNIIIITLLFSMLQIGLFFFLKEKFSMIYQPNVLLEDITNKSNTDGLSPSTLAQIQYISRLETKEPQRRKRITRKILQQLQWLSDLVFRAPINEYRYIGLDSYFILRFLTTLYQLFLLLSIAIIPIFVPLHYFNGAPQHEPGSSATSNMLNSGLDRISMSNIDVSKTDILIIHFFATVLVVCFFHYILLNELRFYVCKKLSFLQWLDINHESSTYCKRLYDAQTTLYLDNLPDKRISFLVQFMGKFGDSFVEEMWFVPLAYSKILGFQKTHLKLLNHLEHLELDLILATTYQREKSSALRIDNENKLDMWKLKKLLFFNQMVKIKINKRLKRITTPWKHKTVTLHYVTLNFNINSDISHQCERIEIVVQKYLKNLEDWALCEKSIKQLSDKPEMYYSKLFIKFNNMYMADFFKQLLLHDSPTLLNNKRTNINFEDIIWPNLALKQNTMAFFKCCLADIVSSTILIGWIIPVTLIGLVSQIPFLTHLLPFFKVVYTEPRLFTHVMDVFLPVVTLIFLTEAVPIFFRKLGKTKGIISHSDIELNVQQWFFIFAFVHVFIVVTVSSGISVVMKQIIVNPVSIPNLLANNFPKCSNFFCSFILIRGLAFFSSNFLQTARLLKMIFETTFHRHISIKTPRYQFDTISKNTLVYRWGSIYPIFSLLASIALIYCVIQPMILLMAFVAFALILISFKYTLKYQVNKKQNHMETFGEFYPRAWFQIYSGVYCLEIFMVGLFAISSCYKLSFAMLAFFVMTMVAHFQVIKYYKKILKDLPVSKYHRAKEVQPATQTSDSCHNIVPFLEKTGSDDIVWLPRDDLGISDFEIKKLSTLHGTLIKISNSHSRVNSNGNVELV